jgi:hypothetical protein
MQPADQSLGLAGLPFAAVATLDLGLVADDEKNS